MPTNGMTIDGLNTVSSLTAQDEVPVWDKEASSEPTRKITAQNMANSVKSLASLPNTTEMNTAIAQSTAIDLLWSNSNPYAAFAAQTISLDITPYRYIIIEFIASSNSVWAQSMYAIAFSGDHIVTLELAQSYFRRYYVSGIKVQFDSAYTFNTYGSWQQTEDNAILIPLKIYGVK